MKEVKAFLLKWWRLALLVMLVITAVLAIGVWWLFPGIPPGKLLVVLVSMSSPGELLVIFLVLVQCFVGLVVLVIFCKFVSVRLYRWIVKNKRKSVAIFGVTAVITTLGFLSLQPIWLPLMESGVCVKAGGVLNREELRQAVLANREAFERRLRYSLFPNPYTKRGPMLRTGDIYEIPKEEVLQTVKYLSRSSKDSLAALKFKTLPLSERLAGYGNRYVCLFKEDDKVARQCCMAQAESGLPDDLYQEQKRLACQQSRDPYHRIKIIGVSNCGDFLVIEDISFDHWQFKTIYDQQLDFQWKKGVSK